MQYIFHLPEGYSFEKVGIKGKIFDSKSLSERVEFSIIETEEGHQTKIIEKECIFTYYILEGTGSFEIEDETFRCSQGELVVIPNGVRFRYSGKMKTLLVCAPWWTPDQEETLED